MLPFNMETVVLAYQNGIFPMYYEDTDEILWFQPDPRAILPLYNFHVSHSLAKTLRRQLFEIRFDTDFQGVMLGCADREEGTWISDQFIQVYCQLHRAGLAHSVEAWQQGKLVGGTYGVALRGAFMAESMFHRETDASKAALAGLVARLKARGCTLLDVQYLTPHLKSLGAIEISHEQYLIKLQSALSVNCSFSP